MEKNLPLTVDFLDSLLRDDLKLCLKTGDVYSGDYRVTKAKFNMDLVHALHSLFISGELYLPRYNKLFFKSKRALQTTFKRLGFKTLSEAENNELYKEHIEQSRRQTNLQKYGVPCVTQNSEILKKREQTNIHRYGYKAPISNPEIREKYTQTMIANYGVPHSLQSDEIKSRKFQTTFDRYGVQHSLQSPKIKGEIEQRNIEKYGVPYITHLSSFHDRVQETKRSNDPRYNTIRSMFDLKQQGILGEEIAVEFITGNFCQSAANEYLKALELKSTKEYLTELKTASILDKLNIEYKRNVMRDHGVSKNSKYYELDFMIGNLGIEVNGVYVHSPDGFNKNLPEDSHKCKFMKFWDAGIKMISFTCVEVFKYPNFVQSVIEFHLGSQDLCDVLSNITEDFMKDLDFKSIDDIISSSCYCLSIPDKFELEITPRIINGLRYFDSGNFKIGG